MEVRTEEPVISMMKTIHPNNSAGNTSKMGPSALHGSASSPGPGTKHLLYGEDGRLSDASADPWELEGHLGSRGGLRLFMRQILGR